MTVLFILTLLVAPPDGAGFQYPISCAVDADGTIYALDRGLPGIWSLEAGKAPAVLLRGGTVFRAPLNAPGCLALIPTAGAGAGALLVGDSATRRIYQVDLDDDPIRPTPFFPGEEKPGRLGVPSALAVRADGAAPFAADLESQRIYRLSPDRPPSEITALAGVRSLCFAPHGSLFALTSDRNPIRRLTESADGRRWDEAIAVSGRPFESPQGLAIDAAGTLYVSDNGANCIWKLRRAGDGTFATPTKLAADGHLRAPAGLCLDATTDSPRLLVADPRARAIFAVRLADGAITDAVQ